MSLSNKTRALRKLTLAVSVTAFVATQITVFAGPPARQTREQATAPRVKGVASPRDVCRALARLARSDDARALLAEKPGVPAQSGRWEYIGFKGGSELGVLAVAWMVGDAEGRQYVLAGGVANDTVAIPEQAAVAALSYLRDTISG